MRGPHVHEHLPPRGTDPTGSDGCTGHARRTCSPVVLTNSSTCTAPCADALGQVATSVPIYVIRSLVVRQGWPLHVAPRQISDDMSLHQVGRLGRVAGLDRF